MAKAISPFGALPDSIRTRLLAVVRECEKDGSDPEPDLNQVLREVRDKPGFGDVQVAAGLLLSEFRRKRK